MPQFQNKEEFLDALYDHLYAQDEEVTAEDETWFDHLAGFFTDDNDSGGGNNNDSGRSNSRRRQRRQPSRRANPPRRRSTSSGYGSARWFGND